MKKQHTLLCSLPALLLFGSLTNSLNSRLMAAASEGDVDRVRGLLHRGARAQASKDGETALIAAIEGLHRSEEHSQLTGTRRTALSQKYRAVLRLLLAHRADVNTRGHEGKTALMVAAETGAVSMVRSLLNHGARIHLRDTAENTALGYAVQADNAGIVQALLDNGARDRGETLGVAVSSDMSRPLPLLTMAVYNNNSAIVRALLKHGAKVDALDGAGKAALLYASDVPMVKTLLAYGARLNPKKRGDRSILDDALASFSVDFGPDTYISDTVIDALLDAGAVDAEAMTLAVSRTTIEPLKKMLRLRWNPDRRDAHGITPLMAASFELRPEFVRLLLQHKAKVNLRTKDGQTALSLARHGEAFTTSEVTRIPARTEASSHPVGPGSNQSGGNEDARAEVVRLLRAAGAQE